MRTVTTMNGDERMHEECMYSLQHVHVHVQSIERWVNVVKMQGCVASFASSDSGSSNVDASNLLICVLLSPTWTLL